MQKKSSNWVLQGPMDPLLSNWAWACCDKLLGLVGLRMVHKLLVHGLIVQPASTLLGLAQLDSIELKSFVLFI